MTVARVSAVAAPGVGRVRARGARPPRLRRRRSGKEVTACPGVTGGASELGLRAGLAAPDRARAGSRRGRGSAGLHGPTAVDEAAALVAERLAGRARDADTCIVDARVRRAARATVQCPAAPVRDDAALAGLAQRRGARICSPAGVVSSARLRAGARAAGQRATATIRRRAARGAESRAGRRRAHAVVAAVARRDTPARSTLQHVPAAVRSRTALVALAGARLRRATADPHRGHGATAARGRWGAYTARPEPPAAVQRVSAVQTRARGRLGDGRAHRHGAHGPDATIRRAAAVGAAAASSAAEHASAAIRQLTAREVLGRTRRGVARAGRGAAGIDDARHARPARPAVDQAAAPVALHAARGLQVAAGPGLASADPIGARQACLAAAALQHVPASVGVGTARVRGTGRRAAGVASRGIGDRGIADGAGVRPRRVGRSRGGQTGEARAACEQEQPPSPVLQLHLHRLGQDAPTAGYGFRAVPAPGR